MKTLKKALLLALCAVLVVGGSILGTLAYLTDTETVTNTFTVGDIRITLDEAVTNTEGKPMKGNTLAATVAEADRTSEGNEYHLLSGLTYTKDPVLTVEGGSESCYIYIQVDNGILALETVGTTSIAEQIKANGWTELEGVENVYWKSHSQSAADTKYATFTNFTIDGDKVDGAMLSTYQGATVTVTGYAVQKAGLSDAKAAWEAAGFGSGSVEDPRGVEITEGSYGTYKPETGWYSGSDRFIEVILDLNAGDVVTVDLEKENQDDELIMYCSDSYSTHYFSSESPESYTIEQTGRYIFYTIYEDFRGSLRIWVKYAD